MPLTARSALSKDRMTARYDNPAFQHRHFAMIAAIIRDMARVPGNEDWEGHAFVARHFATELASTNPRFDRDRFLRACGVL